MNWRKLIFFCFFLIGNLSLAQKVTISGMVVDSASLVAVPHAQITISSLKGSVLADRAGKFSVSVEVFDTLIFSSVAYNAVIYPVLLGEEDILIRLSETVIVLPEIVTTGTKLQQVRYGQRREIKSPTPTLGEGLMSPFTYFSKTEREKRKVIKLRSENNTIRTFVEVVNDPDLKREIMNEFSIDEARYYSLLARFNRQNRYVQQVASEVKIREILVSFFRTELRRKDTE